MPATVDDRLFKKSMRLMAMVPGKVIPDILNKSVLKVAIGSKGSLGLTQLTQKATQARIERDLKTNKLGIKLAVNMLKKRGQKITRQAIASAYEAIRKSRVKSRAYIAAGWLWAARDLVHRMPEKMVSGLTRLKGNKHLPVRDDASAAQSYAFVATTSYHTAALFNTSRGAGSVCPDSVVQHAVNEATADILVYLRKKFGDRINSAIAQTTATMGVAEMP